LLHLCSHCSPSDHFPIFTKLSVDRTPLLPPTFHLFRRLHSTDIKSFLSDLQCSRLITNLPNSLGSLLIAYNITLSFLFNKHAPVINKFSSRKSKSNHWFTSTLHPFKSTVRRAENIWKRIQSALDWSSFKSLHNRYRNLILASKKQYYSNLVSSSDNPRRFWQTIKKLLRRNSSSPLPTCTPASALADSLASFFTDKISKLRLSLTSSSSTSSSYHSPSSPKTPPDFSTFKPASESEISKILSTCPNKQCDSDPIPAWLLKECSALT